MLEVSLGIDVEPDCPPYLATQYRGIEEGLPKVLELLRAEGIAVTCFCTGEVAQRYPDAVREILSRGHELGCHGHTHRRFDRMPWDDAVAEVDHSSAVLRGFGAPVTSFRAPNLRLPVPMLRILSAAGYRRDSSQGKYKASWFLDAPSSIIERIPASTTSSVLRLPSFIRDPLLRTLRSPVVLFVHPWEFVDLTREQLRLDCRFRTGDAALNDLGEVIALFRSRGARFTPLSRVVTPARAA